MDSQNLVLIPNMNKVCCNLKYQKLFFETLSLLCLSDICINNVCPFVIAGESKEITISFNSDHASELYADEVAVEINSGVSGII